MRIISVSILGETSIRINNWKLIPGSSELFDLDNDLEEMNNVFDQRPEKVKVLKEKLDDIVNRVNEREERTREGREGPNVC